MLIKNLENYIDKDQFFDFLRTENNFNYSIEKNITFFMNEDDNVVEIQTFSKTLKSELIKRDDGNFIFYYEETPTERKVTRNRLIVKTSVSRTLKSAEIPPEIAKEFIQQLSYTIDFQRDVKSGDIIDILYEADVTKNNNIVGKPDYSMDLMNLKDHKLELFKYTLGNGTTDYLMLMEKV